MCVLAYNDRGFDFQFILKYVMENSKFTPEVIMRGCKIILLELDNVCFEDSLSDLPLSIAFNFPVEKKKGEFLSPLQHSGKSELRRIAPRL